MCIRDRVTVLNGGILDSIASDFTFSDSVTITSDLTVNGTTTLTGPVEGRGFDEAVNERISQAGAGTIHVHGTATSPGGITTPDGGLLVARLPAGDDYREAVSFYTYDNTMVWRFILNDDSFRAQFNEGDYYATNGYFSTTGVESDAVQSGQWLLLCTGRTQESSRLDVYFRVITDGIMPTTNTSPGDEWQPRVEGSSFKMNLHTIVLS